MAEFWSSGILTGNQTDEQFHVLLLTAIISLLLGASRIAGSPSEKNSLGANPLGSFSF